MSASSQCPHSDVHYSLNLASFGDTNLRYLEIKGHCRLCDAPLRFRGRVGMGPDEPKVSFDGREINLPILFGDEKPTGNPIGFSVRMPE